MRMGEAEDAKTVSSRTMLLILAPTGKDNVNVYSTSTQPGCRHKWE